MGHVIIKNLDWVEYKIYIRYERNLEERFFLVGEGGHIYIPEKDSMTFHLFLILYDS
jgi:hypothetical protein